MSIKTIFVGPFYNGDMSERAPADSLVDYAIDMASKFNAELVAVKVIPRYVQTYFEGSFTVADIDVKSIEAQWRQVRKWCWTKSHPALLPKA